MLFSRASPAPQLIGGSCGVQQALNPTGPSPHPLGFRSPLLVGRSVANYLPLSEQVTGRKMPTVENLRKRIVQSLIRSTLAAECGQSGWDDEPPSQVLPGARLAPQHCPPGAPRQ